MGREEEELAEEASAISSSAFKAHVPLPSQQAIEAALVEKKRRRLLAKMAGMDAEPAPG